MWGVFKKLLGADPLVALRALGEEVNALEEEIKKLSDEALKEESVTFRARLKAGETLDDIAPRAFAVAREAAWRTLGQRPFDVQILGGLALHKGAIAEMTTGEGKTLSGVAPAYLNALAGEGTHVVTVNEYLARRDAVWMGQIYRALGLKVACLVPNSAFMYDPDFHVAPEGEKLIDKERDTTGSFLVQQEFLRPVSRREAYLADITYGTNHEFGFDYLRDNLVYSLSQQVQRGHFFAIIDEVDSILIDEARTPLIISAPDEQSSEFYKTFARVADRLVQEEDYTVDEKRRSVAITDAGIEKVEKAIKVQNIYDPAHLRLVHYLEESLRAKALFKKDKDYVVKNDEIIIVDEFTGRLLQGRRYNGGLHQAIEAKEGVFVKEESKTYAKISIQNYFRMYKKISGMTGTAQTSAEEFHKVYGLEVISIPTHRPLARKDEQDAIYKDTHAKWRAIVRDVKARYEKGQPVLVGTTSIEKNEIVSALLSKELIPHEVLNAKNNEREGAIIAQAGRMKGVMVATNVAGRGVDIILGGNPPNPDEAKKVRDLGGLHVIGTERHEARRIDNQLRGRAGRQGDPGSSQFYLSLDDDLMRIFGGERIKNFMNKFDVPDDEPIQMGFVSSAVAEAQSKVEGANFDIRKHLLEYDDVLNKQRSAVYRRRQEILGTLTKDEIRELVFTSAKGYMENMLAQQEAMREQEEGGITDEDIKKAFEAAGIVTKEHPYPLEATQENLEALLRARADEAGNDPETGTRILNILDLLWMNHLENLDALSESVGLRAYGQRDPLVEYREESKKLFNDFWNNFDAWIFINLFKLLNSAPQTASPAPHAHPKPALDVSPEALHALGRNDPCPCGSGKKYKKCHGE